MLKQIIVGEELVPVKYHGQVKFLVFECNQCHTQFKKEESYYRKQTKRRAHACCFCSPKCRTTYQMNNLPITESSPQPQQPTGHIAYDEQTQPVIHAQADVQPEPLEPQHNEQEKETSIGGWLSKLFK